MNLLLIILAATVVAFLVAFVIVKFIPLKMRWLVSILLLAISVYLAYLIYGGVMEPIKFNQDKKVRYAKVIKKLKLIRKAEEKYNKVHGKYCKDKQALINFIENDSLPITETTSVEQEVHVGGGIMKKISVKKVDTVRFEKVLNDFKGDKYREMFKVPNTKEEFKIETGQVEKVAKLMVPVFLAKIEKKVVLKGLNPMLIKQEAEAIESDQIKGAYVSVGSLEEVTTGGNWPPFYDKAEALAEKK